MYTIITLKAKGTVRFKERDDCMMKKISVLLLFVFIMSMPVTNVFAGAITGTSFFDLGNMRPGGIISDYERDGLPYVQKKENILNNDILDPVFRLKLNEGNGSTVTEAVSGRTAVITGGYEWVDDAKIRYGCSLPLQYRSNTALKLESGSYINLGNFPELDFNKDMTIAFWTNTEVQGRKDDYVEAADHLSLSYGHIRCANKFSNLDYNVIFHTGNFDFSIKYNSVWFTGSGFSNAQCRVPQPLLDTNYYNLYFIVIRGGEQVLIETYGNDKDTPSGTTAMESWGTATFADGDLYIGTPNIGTYTHSSHLGLADIMIFDKVLTYQERLKLYYGINQYGFAGLE
jgi:hypothetical protein